MKIRKDSSGHLSTCALLLLFHRLSGFTGSAVPPPPPPPLHLCTLFFQGKNKNISLLPPPSMFHVALSFDPPPWIQRPHSSWLTDLYPDIPPVLLSGPETLHYDQLTTLYINTVDLRLLRCCLAAVWQRSTRACVCSEKCVCVSPWRSLCARVCGARNPFQHNNARLKERA